MILMILIRDEFAINDSNSNSLWMILIQNLSWQPNSAVVKIDFQNILPHLDVVMRAQKQVVQSTF